MTKFLAILNGAATETDRPELSEQQQHEFMAAWGEWAHKHESALLDPGAPLYWKKRVSQQGVEDFTDLKVAYCLVEASSHDEAARIFAEHPHVRLLTGNSIDILECPPPPA